MVILKMKMKKEIMQSKLYKKIISPQNIFYSIYSVQSYIFEKELLEEDDYQLLIRLGDRFDNKTINKTIKNLSIFILYSKM